MFMKLFSCKSLILRGNYYSYSSHTFGRRFRSGDRYRYRVLNVVSIITRYYILYIYLIATRYIMLMVKYIFACVKCVPAEFIKS